MRFNLEKQKRIFNLLLNAMGSDNADYILKQLSEIYTIIFNNNIDNVGNKYLCEDTDIREV